MGIRIHKALCFALGDVKTEAGEPPKRYSWDEETVSWVEVVE